MAKLAVINRDKKRRQTVAKFAARRAALLAIINDAKRSDEERQEAREKQQELPMNASPLRLRNRCRLTGVPRGVFLKFGLGRNKLREIALRGEIPGLIKASWYEAPRMSMTDPIADLLTRIRNAQTVGKTA